MLFQPSPQTTMIMPVGAGTAQLPGGFTYALVQPQKPQQITQKHLSVPQTQMQKTVKVVRLQFYYSWKYCLMSTAMLWK